MTVSWSSGEIHATCASCVRLNNRNGVARPAPTAVVTTQDATAARRGRQDRQRHAVHRDEEHHERVEHDRGHQEHEVEQPRPRPIPADRGHQHDRQPHGGHGGERVRPGLDARPRRARQHGEHDARAHGDRPVTELSGQDDDARTGRPDREAARRPRRELGDGEDREPAVHQEVVEAVDGVDVLQESPQRRQRAGRRGDRGGFVEPRRRSARACRAHPDGQDRDEQRIPGGPHPTRSGRLARGRDGVRCHRGFGHRERQVGAPKGNATAGGSARG